MNYSLALVCSLFVFNALAESTNICDALIASKTASPEQITKCLEKKGKSEYYVEQMAKAQEDTKGKSDKTNNKKMIDVETKVITEKELLEEGYGLPFIALRTDYRKRPNKETRMTQGNALCRQFGYEKVTKSVFSPEIQYQLVDKKSLIIDTPIFGSDKKEPELYSDDKQRYRARKYVEVTCVKRKNIKDDISELDSIPEVIVMQK
jgi:hypothetical protein